MTGPGMSRPRPYLDARILPFFDDADGAVRHAGALTSSRRIRRGSTARCGQALPGGDSSSFHVSLT
jgi:hypothetical protein